MLWQLHAGRQKPKCKAQDLTCGQNSNSVAAQYLYNPKQGIPVKTATKEETLLVVPTTEELNYQIQNPKHLLEIAKLRKDARQLTEEKVAIANQTCSLIDSYIQRLDVDLEKFEK